MNLGRLGAIAASFVLVGVAHAVYDQPVALTGQGATELAEATVSFTTDSGETVDVRTEPSATVDGDIDLFLELPDGSSSPPGKLTFTQKDGSVRTFELPSAPAGERPRIDLRTGRVTLETTPTFATVASTTPQVTFVPPPPFSGPVVQWSPETMSEEDRLAIQERLKLTNEQAEARALANEPAELQRIQQVMRDAAPARDAAEEKAIEYARAHKLENLSDWMLVGFTGEDGHYDSITIRMKAPGKEVEATFDGDGNVLTPFAETPESKAMRSARAHKTDATGMFRADSDKDVYGNTFIREVRYDDGKSYLLFNERGVAYEGEFFGADGKRTGAFSDPSEKPQYGDPLGRLPPIDYQPVATTQCEPCQPLVDRYNALAGEMNQIAREMNDLSEQHRAGHERANKFKDYGQELPVLRGRYEHLAPIWRDKAIELAKLRDELIDCVEKECGEPAEDVGCTGTDCVANPFDEPIYLAGADDGTVPAVWAPSDAYESSTCPYLTQPAETIACSVHTFERTNLCGASPSDADWSTGECTAGEDGGSDTEVFVRNPDDNNLRNGCGDIDRKMLIGNFGPVFEKTEYQVIHIACNRYAQDANADPRGIIRGHREQLNVDSSNREKADHDRQQRRNQVDAGRSNLHLAVRDAVNDTVATGVGQPCTTKAPVKEKEKEEDDPDWADIGGNAKTVIEQAAQVASPDEGTTRLEAVVGTLGAGNKVLEATGGKADKVSTLIKAAEAGVFVADKTVRTLSGEAVLSLDAKTAVEHAAAISGNGALETLGNGFGVLQKLKEIKLQKEQGIPIETSDVKELADALDEVRGDRFEGLGTVLAGIGKSAELIGKGEEVIEDLMKVWDILKPGARPTDPADIMEAFADYLEILAKLAGYVPGMGEFVAKYAEAVRSMQANVQQIADATERRNKAIAMWNEAVEGYNYKLLLQDAQQFQQETGMPAGGGEQLSADEINLNRATAEQRAAVDDAEQDVRHYVDCVNGRLLDLYQLQLDYDQLRKDFSKLPTEKQKQARILQANFAAQYLTQMQASPGWSPNAEQAARMGASSPFEAAEQLRKLTQPRAADAVQRARQQLTQEGAHKKAEDLRKEYQRLKAALEECNKKLMTAYQQFWQATRDYAAAYSYFHTLATQKGDTTLADANRKAALAEIDQQIAKAGFSVSGTKVVVVAVSDCDEKKTAVMVGR